MDTSTGDDGAWTGGIDSSTTSTDSSIGDIGSSIGDIDSRTRPCRRPPTVYIAEEEDDRQALPSVDDQVSPLGSDKMVDTDSNVLTTIHQSAFVESNLQVSLPDPAIGAGPSRTTCRTRNEEHICGPGHAGLEMQTSVCGVQHARPKMQNLLCGTRHTGRNTGLRKLDSI
jgi:hypothetical protein